MAQITYAGSGSDALITAGREDTATEKDANDISIVLNGNINAGNNSIIKTQGNADTHASGNNPTLAITVNSDADLTSGPAAFEIEGYSKLTVADGAKLKGIMNTHGIVLVNGGTTGYIKTRGTGKTTISGANTKITGDVDTFDNGVTNISAGEVTGAVECLGTGECTITGGKFTKEGSGGKALDVTGSGKVTVSGGTFKGTTAVNVTGGETTIKGGTFYGTMPSDT